MLRLAHRLSLCIILIIVTGSCSGSDGNSLGILLDSSGNPVAGVVVQLVTIDDSGGVQTVLGTTTSDTDGRFDFSNVEITGANSSIVMQATVSSSVLRGFFSGNGSSRPINPITEQLVTLILQITATTGGRSHSDFTSEELVDITRSLLAADSSNLDQTSSSAVLSFVKDQVGRQVAVASGGTISAVDQSTVGSSPTTGTGNYITESGICDGESFHRLSSENFNFLFRSNGTFCISTGNSLTDGINEGGVQLLLDDTSASEPNTIPTGFSATTFTTRGDREIEIGPVNLTLTDGGDVDYSVSVKRRIFVPQTGDYARFLEIITNNSSQTRNVQVGVDVQFNDPLATNAKEVFAIESGSADTADRYFAVKDTALSLITTGFVLQDTSSLRTVGLSQLSLPTASVLISLLQYDYAAVEIAPAATKIIMHFVLFSSSKESSVLTTALAALAESPDFTNMSLTETTQVDNFASRVGTITGEAGAVVPDAVVNAIASGSFQSVTASSDGSFIVPLAVSTGDSISLTASDGLDTTITVE